MRRDENKREKSQNGKNNYLEKSICNFVAVNILYLKCSASKPKKWNTYSQQPEMFSITVPWFHCFHCLCVYVNCCNVSMHVQWVSYLSLIMASLLPADCSLCSRVCLSIQNDDRGGQLLRAAAQASVIQSTGISLDPTSIGTISSKWVINHCISPIVPFPLTSSFLLLLVMLGQLTTCHLAFFCNDLGRYNFTEARNTPVLTRVCSPPTLIFLKVYLAVCAHHNLFFFDVTFSNTLALDFFIQMTSMCTFRTKYLSR